MQKISSLFPKWRVPILKEEPIRMAEIQRDVLNKCCGLIQFLSKSVVYLCIVTPFSQCAYLYFLWTLLLGLNWQYNCMIRVGDGSEHFLQKSCIQQYWISNSRNYITVKSLIYCYITTHIRAHMLLPSFTELVFLIWKTSECPLLPHFYVLVEWVILYWSFTNAHQ